MDNAEQQGRTIRRRGAELEQAILEATAAILVEVGYANLTMDGVAHRAGTSKNVIYRRWPNRAALSIAAYRHMLTTGPQDTPDTGDLRCDTLALLHQANDRMSSPAGQVLRAILADMQNDPELTREIRDQFVRASAGPWLTILARAVSRAEVSPAVLIPRVATVAVDLLRNEYGLNGVTTLPASTIVEIVDQVFLPLVRAYR